MSSKKQCTHNEAQESLRDKMRKLQSEMTKLKRMVGDINLTQGLNIRITMRNRSKNSKLCSRKSLENIRLWGNVWGK